MFGNGNNIGKKIVIGGGAANGVWSLSERYNAGSNWPPPIWNSSINLFKTATRSPTDIYAWCGTATVYNCTISRDTTVTDSPYGGVPLKMVPTTTFPYISSYNALQWNIASAATGQTWQVRFLVKSSAASLVRPVIFGANAAGTYLGTAGTMGSFAEASTTTQWKELSFQYTFTGAGVEMIQIRLDGPTDGNAASIWFDGLQVYKIS